MYDGRTAIALLMEAADISETSTNFYRSRWRKKPQGNHLKAVEFFA
jgi:hypothetical protein